MSKKTELSISLSLSSLCVRNQGSMKIVFEQAMRKAGTGVIMRSSIHAYLKGYQTFTYMAALLVFPASTSLLLSHSLIPPSAHLFHLISRRLRSLFRAANFPHSSSSSAGHFFAFLDCKLTQTIFSFFFTLPFVLTFLLLAKASIIYIFRHHSHGDDPPETGRRRLGLYRSLLLTHLLNSFIILSVNATTFAFLCLVFNAADLLGLSSSSSSSNAAVFLLLTGAGAVLYAVVVANTTVVCNLAIVISAMDGDCAGGGYLTVLKACLLIRGRLKTALGLALVANLGMAATEALFQYRVVKQYYSPSSSSSSIALILEAFLVTYLHAILVVLEVIASCIFYKTCKAECVDSDLENGLLEPAEKK